MDNNNRKRSMYDKRPTCKYGKDCYRLNPAHLKDFKHAHLEEILLKHDPKASTTFEVPQELWFTREIVRDQLAIISKWFDKDDQSTMPAKVSKKADDTVHNSPTVTDAQPSTSNSFKTTPNLKPSPPKQQLQVAPSSSNATQKSEAKTDTSKPSTDNLSVLEKKKLLHAKLKNYFKVVMPMGKMAEKLEKASPYNFFMSTITDSVPTHSESLSITFQELLDHSLGELESSVQINFMIDIGWLLGNYYFAGYALEPLLVLYGDESPEIRDIATKRKNVVSVKVQMPTPFACSHSKVGLYGYRDGSLRIVVSTANLYEDDWQNRVQGIWVSLRLPALASNSDTDAGESPTGFRADLLQYLITYKVTQLQPWISRIRKTDFSSVNVFFVASVPGGHRDLGKNKGHPYGHARLGDLLAKHCAPIDDSSPIVCQSSSIGSLGPKPEAWILSEYCSSLRKDSGPKQLRRMPAFKMIYPSFTNVRNSHDNLLGGGCLPYGKNINDKQPWLKSYLHQWKSKKRHRTQAMPHIKSYCRWGTEGVHWFLLTSANLSKAAWGAFNKSAKFDAPLRVNNYEAGVLFLPKFVTGESHFPLTENSSDPPFPMPYDIPLTPYGSDDTPFLQDILHEKV